MSHVRHPGDAIAAVVCCRREGIGCAIDHELQWLQVDKINRTVAARLVGALTNFRQFDKQRQEMIKKQLQRIKDQQGRSENVFEIASKSLE